MSDTPNTKTVSRAAALSATKAGGEAARAGQEVADNPHGTDSVEDRFLGNFWTKGFAAAKAGTTT